METKVSGDKYLFSCGNHEIPSFGPLSSEKTVSQSLFVVVSDPVLAGEHACTP
jgi:hypothetical protein